LCPHSWARTTAADRASGHDSTSFEKVDKVGQESPYANCVDVDQSERGTGERKRAETMHRIVWRIVRVI
jgi:hypothetical protein